MSLQTPLYLVKNCFCFMFLKTLSLVWWSWQYWWMVSNLQRLDGVDMYGLFIVYLFLSLSNAEICLGFLSFVHVVFWTKGFMGQFVLLICSYFGKSEAHQKFQIHIENSSASKMYQLGAFKLSCVSC